MEELFFSALTGSVQIDNIIPYILRMETAEYNLQMTGQTGAAAVAGISGSIGVPALHDPNSPNQPASVPVVLESSQQVTFSYPGSAEAGCRSTGGHTAVGNTGSCNIAHVMTAAGNGVGIQRTSLISDAGQVLTLYSDIMPTPPSHSSASTAT